MKTLEPALSFYFLQRREKMPRHSGGPNSAAANEIVRWGVSWANLVNWKFNLEMKEIK